MSGIRCKIADADLKKYIQINESRADLFFQRFWVKNVLTSEEFELFVSLDLLTIE